MLREYCAENLTNVAAALQAGAKRIELCDNLAVGGTTPSYGIIEQAIELAHGLGGTVMVMIRPRGGDFSYNDVELRAMEADIRVARSLKADGVVFGCVKDGQLDLDALNRLVETTRGLDMTFHMAFDELGWPYQQDALLQLADMGFSRVLTHGGPLDMPIDECVSHLQELVAAAKGRIAIMPGGGVTWHNCEYVSRSLGVTEVHGTRTVPLA